MDNFGDLVGFLVFVVFIVVAIARKVAEQKDVTGRQQQMRRQKPEDLPEATRRMLYGDNIPTARPRTHSEDGEPPVVIAPHREPYVPTAQPRQGQPRRVAPPPVAPRQTTARGAMPPPIHPAPPLRKPTAPPRERPVQEHMPFRPQEEQRRLAPEHRREAPPLRQQPQRRREQRREAPPPVAPVQQQQRRRAPKGPPIPTAPAPRQLRYARQAGTRFFESRGDVRRAIVMSEILGPPKAFQ